MSPRLRRGAAAEAPTGPPVSSALLLVGDHASRGHQLAALLRAHVDELVIAAATKLSDRELELLDAARPDRLVRVPFGPDLNRALEPLLHLVTGEWVLWLRDDEVPSAALLDAFGALTAADAPALGYGVPTGWLWPDTTQLLDRRPWWPDVRTRLLRTTAALRHVPAWSGATPMVPGPVVLLDAPVLRLELLDRAAGDISEPVDDRPANPLGSAFPDPTALLDVDGVPAPPTRPVDPRDAELVQRVLAEPEATRSQLRGLPQTLPASDLERHWTRRRVPADRYAGRIELAERDTRFDAGAVRPVLVRVHNESAAIWPGLDRPEFPVRASYRFLDGDGGVVVSDGMRTPLPNDVPPGGSALVELLVAAPGPGSYVLEVDLVHEFERWFGIAVTSEVDVR